jgi:hypothetical protein
MLTIIYLRSTRSEKSRQITTKSHITTELEAKLDISMFLVLGAEESYVLTTRLLVMIICDKNIKILWRPVAFSLVTMSPSYESSIICC